MLMLNRIFKFLYHFCWYVFAFIIMSAAVVVTIVRLALPGIGNYKTEIQDWINKQIEFPIVIDDISAEWQGWTPNLYLGNIDLYTQDKRTIITTFDSAHIDIDMIASLQAWEVIPNYLLVTGLNIGISRKLDGSLSINDSKQGFNTNASNNAALSNWLLTQKHLILKHASVTWHDEKSPHKNKQFSDVQIQLRTDKQRLQLDAELSLPEQLGQNLNIKMDVTGNILTSDWRGSVYIATENFKPSDLLDAYPVKSVGGIANFELWTSWEQSRLIDFSIQGDYADFLLVAHHHQLPINKVSLNFFGEHRLDNDWLLHIQLDELQTASGLWPPSSHQISIEKNSNNNRYKGYFSYLKFAEVAPFIIAANIIPEQFKTILTQHTVTSDLIALNIDYQPEAKTNAVIQVNTAFQNLTITSPDKNSFISGFAGTLMANNEQLTISLESKLPKMKFDVIHAATHSFSEINADMRLIHNDAAELIIQNLAITNTDLSLTAAGKITFDKPSPFIDLIVHIDETNIENIPAYLPKQTSPNFRTWLNRALVGGKLLSGDLIFHGHLQDYPFNNAEGHFKTLINIENITLDYNEKWPPIDNLTAELVIDNDDLTLSSRSGYIFDAEINKLSAEIKDLTKSKRLLNITGSLHGHTRDVQNFITQSPLHTKTSLNAAIKNITGNFAMDLALNIPLDKSEKSIAGRVSLIDATIASDTPGLGLDDVNGDLHFAQHEVWARDIDARYHGVPVQLTIPKPVQDGPYSKHYELSGVGNKAFIINQLAHFFPKYNDTVEKMGHYFAGESNWTVLIRHLKSDDHTNTKEIELRSDLSGIEIDLPYPFGKPKKAARPLRLSTNLVDGAIHNIKFNFDELFFTDVIIDSQNLMLKKTLIGLGQPHDDTRETGGISIQGHLQRLDVSEWTDIVALDNTTQSRKSQPAQPRHVVGDFSIGELRILGTDFYNVNLKLNKPIDGWQLSFTGDAIAGHAHLIKGTDNRPDKLRVDLTSLSLDIDTNENEREARRYNLNKIPELEVDIEQFTYGDHQLGQLNLRTQNIEQGIRIDNLSISKPDFNITANGTWMQMDDSDRSEFSATLQADTIATMLSTFNYGPANIKDGQTTIALNVRWMDTPMNFSMEKIAGDLDIKIDKGQMLDIDSSAGRLFGLLSIQALPRRLALDFSDLFSKGFSFDSIAGNFSMDQGHAYTNNLTLMGPAADILVSGRTGIIAQDYDQIATIMPRALSNSLPIASALFGPVGIGVGAVIYFAGELFNFVPDSIDGMLMYQYSIKGSWEKPDIVKLKKNNTDN